MVNGIRKVLASSGKHALGGSGVRNGNSFSASNALSSESSRRGLRAAMAGVLAAGAIFGGHATVLAQPALPNPGELLEAPAAPQLDLPEGGLNPELPQLDGGLNAELPQLDLPEADLNAELPKIGFFDPLSLKVEYPTVEPFAPPAGALRQQFGGVGPHPVASTAAPFDCSGPIYTLYDNVSRDWMGLDAPLECYGAFPEGLGSTVGVQMLYPADIANMESAPLIVLSPGVTAEPGMYDRQARLYASHGYVVAMGYNYVNWFGAQMLMAASYAATENQNEASPLHNKIDFSRTLLVGHSAGGGSAIMVNNSMDKLFQAQGIDMHTRGLVAVNPGPADSGLMSAPSSIPTLVVAAEHEGIVPVGMDRRGYSQATGPAWLAVASGSYHVTYMDDPSKNVLGSTVLSFGEYLLQGTPRAKAVYEGPNYSLATDSELSGVERKNIG